MPGQGIITRRRKWSPAQKAALLEEVGAEGGKVAVVARRHGISESLLYNWRSAWTAAASAVNATEPLDFVSLGVVGEAGGAKQRRPVPLKLRTVSLCVRVAGRPVGGRKDYRPNRFIRYDERESNQPFSTPCFKICNHAFHLHFGL